MSYGAFGLLSPVVTTSAMAASPQCRDCGPDYLLLAFAVLFSTAPPWLIGSITLLVVGLAMRAPVLELGAALALGSSLALLSSIALGAAIDTIGMTGLTAAIALFEAVFVLACAARWRRMRRARRLPPS